MATLKDVAKYANVSLSTVSIVVNGKAADRKISQETIDRVTSAVHHLAYRPNISARKIRYAEKSRPRLVLFWPFDNRTTILSSLLTEINLQLHKVNFDCELVIQTYDNDKIFLSTQEIVNQSYNGVIVGGATTNDISYLESLQLQTPVILINRKSSKFSTVCVEAEEVAECAIRLLNNKAIKDVAVVGVKENFLASNQRTAKFIEYCKRDNINIKPEAFIYAHNSFEDGIKAAETYLHLNERPKTIFCESEIIALGITYYFNKSGVRVPKDVSLIAIGTMGSNITRYVIPSITIIDIPTEQIASTIIELFIAKLDDINPLIPTAKKIQPRVYFGDSFAIS